jgi:TonB-linked SusC/RagA family outer membrane protein
MKHQYQYKYLKWAFSLLFLISAVLAIAQDNSAGKALIYTGTLTDINNNPIAGATVEVQEKNITTTTDAAGKFTLETALNDVLVLKMPGYLPTLFYLNRNTEFKVSMERVKLFAGDDDDVAIPFGTRKKRYLTSSISSVKTEELPQPNTSALSNVFSGRLAGLSISQADTRPGNDISFFRVRGQTSFAGFPDAMVLVDGIERDFQDIDINEIENVSVLKDAASLSWYGLRGSNGVVLINTKRGSATKSSIKFDAQYGLQAFDHLIKPLNSYQYATLYNEAYLNDRSKVNSTTAPFYNQATLDAYQNKTDPFLFPDNNYTDRFIRKSSPIQRYVVSAQGGSSRVRYFALLGYMNQQGVFKGTEGPNYNSNNMYKRFNFRGNIDFDITNSLLVSVNIAGRAENRRNPNQSGSTNPILGYIFNTPPNAYPIINANGSFGGNAAYAQNIMGELTERGMLRNIQRVGFANIEATQKLDALIKGLSANVLFSYDAQGDFTSGFIQNYNSFDFSTGAAVPVSFQSRLDYVGGSQQFNNSRRSNEFWAGLDYDRTFSDHKVNASVRGMRRVNSIFVNLDERIQGLSARVDYAFKQKYLLGLTMGYSGDDDLPPANRYGFFPAVSAGWIISDEDFLIGNKTFNFLKLRASHGKVGNSDLNFSRRFGYNTYWDRNATGGGYQFGTPTPTASNSAVELNIGNPRLTYETFTITNAGVDVSLFNNTFSATVDVFKNRREGILTSSAIPSILGQSTGNVNEGIVDSRGLEGSLFYKKDFGQVKFSLNANLLVSDNEVVAQGGQTGLPAYQQTIGRNVYSNLYYISEGIYQNTAEIAAGPKSTLAGSTLPGDIRYKDVNKDGVIDALDREQLDWGSPTYYGFGTALRYKIFDFNAQFQGVSNRTISIQNLVRVGPNGLNQLSLDRWTPATASPATYPRLGLADQGNNTATSDFWLRDAGFLKLKTVELGINLPPGLLSRIHAQSIRFYLSAFNPLTFSKLGLDVDPELPRAGQAEGQYPYARTYSLGLSARF